MSRKPAKKKAVKKKASKEVTVFDPCCVRAYQCLLDFEEAFAEIPEGVKYLPHLNQLVVLANNNREDIVIELERAAAIKRC